MEEWIHTIPFQNKHLLLDLQTIGILAGGCIATPHLCSDIDIFVHDWEQWCGIQAKLNDHHVLYQARCLVSGYVAEHAESKRVSVDPDANKFSVIELTIPGEILPLQIVFSEALTPMELIEGFDMDYVQAAIYQSQFFCTQAFRVANQTHCVSFLRFPLTKERFEKARKKGYLVPWMQTNLVSKPRRWIDLSTHGVLDSFRTLSLADRGLSDAFHGMSLAKHESDNITRIPTLTAPFLFCVEKCMIVDLRHRKTWIQKPKPEIRYWDFVMAHESEFARVSAISVGGHVRDIKKMDVIWFWMEGIEPVFRVKQSSYDFQIGQYVVVVVEASSHRKCLRFEVQKIESGIRPIPIHPSFWSNVHKWISS
jgi:hypothetical protein